MIKETKKQNTMEYNNEDLKNLKGLYLIDFYADWCGPCKMMGQILDQMDINIIKVNVDINEDLAKEYKVMSIPNMVLLKDGEEVNRFIGFTPRSIIEQEIEKFK